MLSERTVRKQLDAALAAWRASSGTEREANEALHIAYALSWVLGQRGATPPMRLPWLRRYFA